MLFNPYAIPPFLVAVVNFVLGTAIYRLDRANSFCKSFFYFAMTSVVWLLASGFLFNSTDPQTALFWGHVMFFAAIFILPTIYHMAVALTHRGPERRYGLRMIYGLAFLGSLMSCHPAFFRGVDETSWGLYPMAGPFAVAIIVFMAACFMLSFIEFSVYHFSLIEPLSRRQVRAFMLLFLLLMFSFLDILTSYSRWIYPVAYLSFLGFVLGISCFKLNVLNFFMKERSRQCEAEVSWITEELEATQGKLFETGKSSIFSNISAGIIHQLTQPVTAINGIAKFVKSEMDVKDKYYRPITLINEQTSYLRGMIEDLMALMRHKGIKRDDTDVNQVLEKSIELLTDELRIQRVNWDVNWGKHLPKIYVDAIHLQQVFMNIMINAMQALATLPQGEQRHIAISSSWNRKDGNVEVSFKDTGPGISDDEKVKIFEPFFSTKPKGTGVGLSLCQNLLSQMGGEISVESHAGQGAVFYVKLAVKN